MLVDVTATDIAACEFRNWYPLFCETSCSIQSRVIALSPSFVRYLLSDGLVLPNEESEYGLEDPDPQPTTDSSGVSFPELSACISETIEELGGVVFVKLNWSAPTDADWIRHQALKCSSPSDIYLLLKASDRIIFDIEHMVQSVQGGPPTLDPVTLILRTWVDIQPSMEFRCFVFHQRLVGICQRECNTYFPFLKQKKGSVRIEISSFFQSTIYPRFPLDSCKIPSTSLIDSSFGINYRRYI